MSDVVGYRVSNLYGSFVCSECVDIPDGDAITQGEATEENAICCMCFRRLDGQPRSDPPSNMDICGWYYIDDYGWGEPPNMADQVIDDLEPYDEERADEFRKRLEIDRVEHPTEGEAWLVDEVVEALNEFCPAGCYVGVDDRGMMGCWPI